MARSATSLWFSGKYFPTLSTGSPQQIWSAAMGGQSAADRIAWLKNRRRQLHFAAQVPADCGWFSVQNVPLGMEALNLNQPRSADPIRLEMEPPGKGDCS